MNRSVVQYMNEEGKTVLDIFSRDNQSKGNNIFDKSKRKTVLDY
jgi:hypothetical protein